MSLAIKKPDIKGLYYITHINNLPSILTRGILSHAEITERAIPFTSIYDAQIVSHRQNKKAGDKSLWHFANLYFQPRNPMLYRVISEKNKNDIAIVSVLPTVLSSPDAWVSIGNAASTPSEILPASTGLPLIYAMWDVIRNEWWKEEDGSKRKIMSECLVPGIVPPNYIDAVYVANHETAERVRAMNLPTGVSVVPEPQMFFQPIRRIRIANNLSLVEGDLFFSQLQTLTISVNTVGVMGKGLASRAKYQFPDVYVVYQDVCRSKQLQMGKPHIYKRESFVDTELASDSTWLPNPNSNKWFLLFPTKNHWKENSDMDGIERGLIWLRENYRQEGITSLAIPALGCGLGGLDWRDVGQIMCRNLADLDIPVGVYLPREQAITQEFLTKEFLLGTEK
jgi:O-acetyl-ADP-ribose deacetylase (regulator of RNase III)